MVAGTELVFTESVPTRKTVDFANDAANFTDGDEFELRFVCTYTGLGGYARYTCVGPIYRAALYVTLDPAMKAQIYIKVGSTEANISTGNWYDTETRTLIDTSLYPPGLLLYLETTLLESPYLGPLRRERSEVIVLSDGHRYTAHYYRNPAGGHVCLTDNYDADFGGSGGVYTTATTATVITNGTLYDPLGQVFPAYEGWRNPDYMLEDEGLVAMIQLNAANDTAIVELSGFDFSALPPAAVVTDVGAVSIHGCIGPPQWVDDFAPDLGSGAPLDAYVDAVTYVGGAIQGTWHSGNCPNWFLIYPDRTHMDMYYPQNSYPQPYPWDLTFSGGASYDFSADRAWAWADVQPGTFALRIRARVTAVKRFLQWFICWVRAYVIAGSVDTVCLDMALTVNARLGNTFVIAEIESPACLSVTASIDSATLLITGTGTGFAATLWRVIRTSDNAVMDSGSGVSASFSFAGVYDTVYQLQFYGNDGVWTSDGCTFTFAGNTLVPCNDIPCSVPKCIPTGTLVEYSGSASSVAGFNARIKQIGPMA
jgi:hypothetical protein